MKKKNKNTILRKKKDFRFHKVKIINKRGKEKEIWHPAYVFYERGNIYIFVTLTHSSEIEGSIVIKLRKNPNPKDNRESYWVVEIMEDTKDRFTRRNKQWILDEQDDADIREEYKKR